MEEVLPVPPGQFTVFAVVCVFTGMALGADLSLPPAIQADVVDYGELKNGRARAGLHFALWSMSTKLALAGFVVSFVLLGYFGVVQASPIKTMIAQFATVVYFGYFLYMPFYSRADIKVNVYTILFVLLYSLVTVVIMIWWWFGEVSVEITSIMTILMLAYTAYFLVLPAFLKPAIVKPVPERVTK